MTTAAPTRDDLRARVRDLIAQGMSNRQIAELPGMPSRETVRRWRAAQAPTPPGMPVGVPPVPGQHADPPADAPPATPNVPPAHGGTPEDVPPTAPARATLPSDVPPDVPPAPPGTPDVPPAHQPGPPRLGIPMDDELRAHLDVLAEAGVDVPTTAAVLLRFAAQAVADAWAHGVCPRGLLPTMRIQSRHPDAGAPPGTSHHA